MLMTDEKREERRRCIGSSDIAPIAGLSKYTTPLDVYREKVGEKESDADNQYTYWGKKLEDVIATEYSLQKKVSVQSEPNTIYHPVHSFMGANVDRLIDDGKGILECKTASEYVKSGWGEPGSDNIPDAYLMQVAHQSKIFESHGIEYVDIAVLIGGNDFRIYRYNRNPELEDRIVAIATHFWNFHVIPRVPPAPKTIHDFLTLFPKETEDTVQATEDAIRVLEALKDVRGEMDTLSQKEEEYKNQIRGMIANAARLIDMDGRKLATWTTQSTNRFDTTTFKKEHPSMYKDFCKTTETRVLRIA